MIIVVVYILCGSLSSIKGGDMLKTVVVFAAIIFAALYFTIAPYVKNCSDVVK